jgi:hypothetical protein
LVVILLLSDISHALTYNQKVLVGLNGVRVLVEHMPPNLKGLGLTRNQIKMEVQLRLRNAGIRVLTEKEHSPGMQELYLNVSTVKGTGSLSNIFACAISMNLEERVFAFANAEDLIGSVWNVGCTGVIGSNYKSAIRENVTNLVDIFIKDYLAANPKH